ncbi:hypothetical protein GCM10010221_21470 [Streptomyces parvus]|nr:hypothetical protein GCM10010221_21470 [Streptomyces parvus]
MSAAPTSPAGACRGSKGDKAEVLFGVAAVGQRAVSQRGPYLCALGRLRSRLSTIPAAPSGTSRIFPPISRFARSAANAHIAYTWGFSLSRNSVAGPVGSARQ